MAIADSHKRPVLQILAQKNTNLGLGKCRYYLRPNTGAFCLGGRCAQDSARSRTSDTGGIVFYVERGFCDLLS
jgi:hypothetical protein